MKKRTKVGCSLSRKSGLLALGSIETLRQRTVADQTSMLLILSFAETSHGSESIFAQGRGGFPSLASIPVG